MEDIVAGTFPMGNPPLAFNDQADNLNSKGIEQQGSYKKSMLFVLVLWYTDGNARTGRNHAGYLVDAPNKFCIAHHVFLRHDRTMISWEEFAEQLRKTGQYTTPPDFKPALFDRILGRFDWYYHLLVTKQVWGCGVIGKRGKLNDEIWAKHCYSILENVQRCGGSLEVTIPESTRTCPASVYVANHMSVLETITLAAVLIPFRHPTIIIKESLLHYPALCHTLRSVNPIAVTRKDARADLKTVLTEGKKSLEAGNSVLIFPQSTRNPIFDPRTFNSLGVKLASRSNAPIVPLALKTDFSGIGPIVKEFGKIERSRTVHYRFGEPIDAAKDEKGAHAKVVEFISNSVREWGGTALDAEGNVIR